MQIIIDTSKLATPFKAIGRGFKRAYHKAADIKLDMDARALLRRAEYETAVQARALQLAPNALGDMYETLVDAADANAESTPKRGTSRNKAAVQPRRRTPK